MPKVSCILTAYNAERYIQPAVESILAQSFEDFELIIVDDGSTDSTPAVLGEFAKRDPRVKVIHQANTKQVVAACNGIDASTGPLIARMDADDVARPDRFARQVAFFDAHPDVVLLGGAYELIDEAGRLLTTMRQPTNDDALQKICLGGRTPICQPLAMFRRDAYYKAGGYRPEFITAEDLDLWLRLGEVGKMACLSDVILQYRQHAGSISETKQEMMLSHQREIVQQAWQRRGLPEQGEFKADLWRATGDANSKFNQIIKYGWWAWNSGQRSTARHYGLRAIKENPSAAGGWKLLACSLLKPLPDGRGVTVPH